MSVYENISFEQLSAHPSYQGLANDARKRVAEKWVESRVPLAKYSESFTSRIGDISTAVTSDMDPSLVDAFVTDNLAGRNPYAEGSDFSSKATGNAGGFINNVERSLGRAAGNIAEQAASVPMIMGLANANNLEERARAYAKAQRATNQPVLNAEQIADLEDFNIYDAVNPDFWSTRQAESLATSGVLIGAGLAAAPLVAGSLPATIALGAGLGIAGGVQVAAESYADLRNQGRSREEAAQAARRVMAPAVASGIASGAITGGMLSVAGKTLTPIMSKGISEIGRRQIAGTLAKGAGGVLLSGSMEGSQELYESASQQAGFEWARQKFDEKTDPSDWIFPNISEASPHQVIGDKQKLETFMSGAITGLMMDAGPAVANAATKIANDYQSGAIGDQEAIDAVDSLRRELAGLEGQDILDRATKEGILQPQSDTAEGVRQEILQKAGAKFAENQDRGDLAPVELEEGSESAGVISSLQDRTEARRKKAGMPKVKISAVTPNEDMQATVDLASHITGKEVVLVAARDKKGNLVPIAEGGLVEGNTILIDAIGTNKTIDEVIGHEMVHAIKEKSPETYAALEKLATSDQNQGAFKRWLDNHNRIREQAGVEAISETDALANEEFVADFIGQMALDKAFLNNIAEGNPAAFDKAADISEGFLTKVVKGLQGKKAGAISSQVTETRANIESILSDFAREAESVAAKPDKATPAAPQTSTEASAPAKTFNTKMVEPSNLKPMRQILEDAKKKNLRQIEVESKTRAVVDASKRQVSIAEKQQVIKDRAASVRKAEQIDKQMDEFEAIRESVSDKDRFDKDIKRNFDKMIKAFDALNPKKAGFHLKLIKARAMGMESEAVKLKNMQARNKAGALSEAEKNRSESQIETAREEARKEQRTAKREARKKRRAEREEARKKLETDRGEAIDLEIMEKRDAVLAKREAEKKKRQSGNDKLRAKVKARKAKREQRRQGAVAALKPATVAPVAPEVVAPEPVADFESELEELDREAIRIRETPISNIRLGKNQKEFLSKISKSTKRTMQENGRGLIETVVADNRRDRNFGHRLSDLGLVNQFNDSYTDESGTLVDSWTFSLTQKGADYLGVEMFPQENAKDDVTSDKPVRPEPEEKLINKIRAGIKDVRKKANLENVQKLIKLLDGAGANVVRPQQFYDRWRKAVTAGRSVRPPANEIKALNDAVMIELNKSISDLKRKRDAKEAKPKPLEFKRDTAKSRPKTTKTMEEIIAEYDESLSDQERAEIEMGAEERALLEAQNDGHPLITEGPIRKNSLSDMEIVEPDFLKYSRASESDMDYIANALGVSQVPDKGRDLLKAVANSPYAEEGVKTIANALLSFKRGKGVPDTTVGVQRLNAFNGWINGLHTTLQNSDSIDLYAEALGSKDIELGGGAFTDMNLAKVNRVALHETIHAYTVRELSVRGNNDPVVRKMVELRDHALSFATDAELKQYGFSDEVGDVKEFVAEAMSSPTFQNFLMRVPSPESNKTGSVWSRLIDLMGNLLSLRGERTTLHDVMDGTFQMIAGTHELAQNLDARKKLMDSIDTNFMQDLTIDQAVNTGRFAYDDNGAAAIESLNDAHVERTLNFADAIGFPYEDYGFSVEEDGTIVDEEFGFEVDSSPVIVGSIADYARDLSQVTAPERFNSYADMSADITQRAEASRKAKKKSKDPKNLANPARSKEYRDQATRVREAGYDAGATDKRTRKMVKKDANKYMKSVYGNDIDALVDDVVNGRLRIENDRTMETELFIRAIRNLEKKPFTDPANRKRFNEALMHYTDQGSDVARALQYRRDSFKTKAQRARHFGNKLLAMPAGLLTSEWEKAKRKGDKKGMNNAVDKMTVKQQRIIDEIRAEGLDPDNLNFEDPEVLATVGRIVEGVNWTLDPTRRHNAIQEYFVSAILWSPKTLAANVLGAGFGVYELGLNRALANAFTEQQADGSRKVTINKDAMKDARMIASATLKNSGDFFKIIRKSFKTGLDTHQAELDPSLVTGQRAASQFDSARLGGQLQGMGRAVARQVSKTGIPLATATKVTDGMARIARVSTDSIVGIDAGLRYIFYKAAMAWTALDSGRAEGKEGADLFKFIQDEMENPTGNNSQDAIDMANYLLFQDRKKLKQTPVGLIADGVLATKRLDRLDNNFVMGVIGAVARQLFPFVTTPANLINIGIGRLTPLSLIDSARGVNTLIRDGKGKWVYDDKAQASVAVVNGAIVSTVWATVIGMMMEDEEGMPMITGSAPFDPLSKEARFQRDAAPPMSVRVGESYYSYARLDPLATSLAAMVDLAISLRRLDEGQDKSEVVASFASRMAGQFKEKAMLRQVDDLSTLVSATLRGQDGYTRSYATNLATSYVPAFVRHVNMDTDALTREHSTSLEVEGSSFTAGDRFRQRVLRKSGQEALVKLDWLGNERAKAPLGTPMTTVPLRLVAPTYAMKSPDSQLNSIIINWNDAHIGDEQYYPTTMTKSVKIDGETTQLTQSEFNDAIKERGILIKRYWSNTMKFSKPDINNPTEKDMERLKKNFDKAHRKAREKLKKRVEKRIKQ